VARGLVALTLSGAIFWAGGGGSRGSSSPASWLGGTAWADPVDEDPRPPVPTDDSSKPPSLLDARNTPAALPEEDKPFYKSTAFWIVTGALVGAAIGLGVYAANHSSPTNLAACPANANLGCYGAGR
jgi:hypothetical protein